MNVQSNKILIFLTKDKFFSLGSTAKRVHDFLGVLKFEGYISHFRVESMKIALFPKCHTERKILLKFFTLLKPVSKAEAWKLSPKFGLTLFNTSAGNGSDRFVKTRKIGGILNCYIK